MDTVDFENLPKDRPWLIKAGFDPTSPDLHLGHAVLLKRLRAWQNEGHQVVMIVGDFTAQIGDPTGKSKTRPTLSKEEIDQNAQTYMEQAFLILDPKKTQVVRNSSWLDNISSSKLLELMQSFTVSQLLTRNDFAQRMAEGTPLGLHEMMYPILQGLDSVHVKADLELGGNDQLFNLMMGRKLQALHNQKEQAVATLPLLLGLDGSQKMSKSLGNHIPLLATPFDMFSQVMSISDKTMDNFASCLELPLRGETPFETKKNLSLDIVSFIHGQEAAKLSQNQWEERFSNRQIPTDLREHVCTDENLAQLLVACSFVPSMNVARQKIKEGAVRLDGVQVFDFKFVPDQSAVLSLGRRHIIKIKKYIPKESPSCKL